MKNLLQSLTPQIVFWQHIKLLCLRPKYTQPITAGNVVIILVYNVYLTVNSLLHPLQPCVCGVHIQSEVIKLFLAQLTEVGLLLQQLTAQDLNHTDHSRALKGCLQQDTLFQLTMVQRQRI